MLATQAAAQTIEHARAILMLVAVGIVVFWRAAIRILIAAAVVAVGAGVILLLQTIHL